MDVIEEESDKYFVIVEKFGEDINQIYMETYICYIWILFVFEVESDYILPNTYPTPFIVASEGRGPTPQWGIFLYLFWQYQILIQG